jgi:hypothetical protein
MPKGYWVSVYRTISACSCEEPRGFTPGRNRIR